MKTIVTMVLLAAFASAADAPAPGPQLTDAQKVAALQLQVEGMQLQEAQRDLQLRFQALSAEACGKDANLVIAPDARGKLEPTCKVNAKVEKKIEEKK